jgi:hypothetical protein
MERYEVINCLAEALTEITGKNIYGTVSSIKDTRFPVYVNHTITLGSDGTEWGLESQKMVNSKEIDKDTAFRQLLVQLLTYLLRTAVDGKLPVQELELKF